MLCYLCPPLSRPTVTRPFRVRCGSVVSPQQGSYLLKGGAAPRAIARGRVPGGTLHHPTSGRTSVLGHGAPQRAALSARLRPMDGSVCCHDWPVRAWSSVPGRVVVQRIGHVSVERTFLVWLWGPRGVRVSVCKTKSESVTRGKAGHSDCRLYQDVPLVCVTADRSAARAAHGPGMAPTCQIRGNPTAIMAYIWVLGMHAIEI